VKPDYEITAFKTAKEWRQWLDKHHADTDGLWLRMYKKASGVESINYAEALDDALCYGWIDGQKKSYDELSFLQKFTPRRKRSMWSKRNIGHITRLTEAELMMPAGIAEVDLAKQDGRWQAAYDSPSEMTVPESFLQELHKHPKAEAFFQTLNKTNTFAIAWQLRTAKTDITRLRRQEKFIVILEAEQKLY
jgi:uncharacterized protein YdeI (YjbR/CyaY-like superfamily)